MEKLKIGYFADGFWAHKAFEMIIEDSSIIISFITVRFDVRDPVLLDYAEKYNIPVVINKNVNSSEFIKDIEKFEVDLFVSMSFNQILKKDFFSLPPLKTINCHAGKLPFYRGRNILNWALINDEKEFGITVHFVDEGIDTGDIILQESYPITDEDNYGTLLEKAYKNCANILYQSIKTIQRQEVKRIKQTTIHPIGMYCGARKLGDELIDWNQTSREIFNFVRGLSKPGPNAQSYVNGSVIKINKVSMILDAPIYKNTIGQVIGKDANKFYVKTKDTIVKIEEYECKSTIRIGDRLKNIAENTYSEGGDKMQ